RKRGRRRRRRRSRHERTHRFLVSGAFYLKRVLRRQATVSPPTFSLFSAFFSRKYWTRNYVEGLKRRTARGCQESARDGAIYTRAAWREKPDVYSARFCCR
ncbi:unnamed protein product, partial [Laminaria digitata]